MGIDTAYLYEGFSEPLLSFPVLVVLVLAILPLAAFIGSKIENRKSKIGKLERARPGYDKLPDDKIPGGTSLGAMLALLGLLLGFALLRLRKSSIPIFVIWVKKAEIYFSDTLRTNKTRQRQFSKALRAFCVKVW